MNWNVLIAMIHLIVYGLILAKAFISWDKYQNLTGTKREDAKADYILWIGLSYIMIPILFYWFYIAGLL